MFDIGEAGVMLSAFMRASNDAGHMRASHPTADSALRVPAKDCPLLRMTASVGPFSSKARPPIRFTLMPFSKVPSVMIPRFGPISGLAIDVVGSACSFTHGVKGAVVDMGDVCRLNGGASES